MDTSALPPDHPGLGGDSLQKISAAVGGGFHRVEDNRSGVLHPHEVSEEEVMEFHWVLTVQHVNDEGNTVTTYTYGLWDVADGKTRSEVFIEILAGMKAANGIPDACVVVFFSLEPNLVTGCALHDAVNVSVSS